jgi:hypothetical protein
MEHMDSTVRRRACRAATRGLGCALLAATLLACSQGNVGRLTGKMHVPAGLQGTAQWGSVWVVEGPAQLSRDLAEHERLIRLALLGKDAEFLRSQQTGIVRLAEIEARLVALNAGRIPTRVSLPKALDITPITPLESLTSDVSVETRDPLASEGEEAIDGLKRALKDTAIVVRGRMYHAVKDLIQRRSDQKARLLADADGIVAEHRIMSARVQLDGEFFLDGIPVGEYGLYGRYVLNQWFVLVPVSITGGMVQRDIPRLSNLVSESRAVSTLDAMVTRIDQM